MDSSVLKLQPKTDASRAYVFKGDYDLGFSSANVNMVIDYTLKERKEPIKILVKPQYLNMDMGSKSISSASIGAERVMFAKLMNAGITLTVNQTNGNVDSIASNDGDVNDFLSNLSFGSGSLQELFKLPGVPATMPAKVDTKEAVMVKGLYGTASILRLTPNYATILIKAPGEQDNPSWMAVTMVVERNTGWLVSLAQIGQVYSTVSGYRVKMNLDEMMYRNTPFQPLMGKKRQPDQLTWHAYQLQNEMANSPQMSDVFTRPFGVLRGDGDRFTLDYAMNAQWIDQVAMTEFQPVVNGSPENLVYSYQPVKASGKFEIRAFSHGWINRYVGSDVQKITATAKFYPLKTDLHTLPVEGKQSTQIDIGDLTARLVPVKAKPRRFRLYLYRSPRSWFNFGHIPELADASIRVLPVNHQFDDVATLTTYGSRQLNQGQLLTTYEIQWPEHKPLPKHLTLQRRVRSATAKFEKTIEFATPQELAKNPDVSPQNDFMHYQPEQSGMVTGPVIENRNQLAFYWNQSDMKRCQLKVATPTEYGHPLTWRSQNPHEFHQRWLLEAADGKHHYFYHRTVKTSLHCQSSLTWQSEPISSATHPWLVDVRQIKNFDLKQPLSSFLSQYRFYDKTGQQLHVYEASAGLKTPLADVLLDKHFLKLSGDVVLMKRAVHQNTPVIRNWTTTLPGLPE